MKRSIGTLILIIGSLSCALADLDDNLIEDFQQVPQDSFAATTTRGRYLVKGCKPCQAGECQLMGMQRFSEPRCEALSGVGAPCRPFQEPENKTLHFPHAILYCDNVHMQFCPCASGLECDLETAECKRRGRQIATYAMDFSSRRAPSSSDNEPLEEDDQEPLPVAFEPMQAALPVVRQQNAGGALRFPWGVARFY